MQLGISQIAHWALKVHDLNRSLAFYRDTLGFEEMLRLSNSEGPAEGHFSLVYLRVTDLQYLELFPDGAGAAAADERTNSSPTNRVARRSPTALAVAHNVLTSPICCTRLGVGKITRIPRRRAQSPTATSIPA